MLPNIWIFDTYSILLLLGVIASLVIFKSYSKHYKLDPDWTYSILMLGVISALAGIVSATLFQLLFNVLENNGIDSYFSMTFFGGLLGGATCFLLIYFLRIKKKYPNANFIEVLTIAPACITAAHGLGRIGCFCAGCCYGIETDSPLGMKFPHLDHAVYPTQLFEAIFLFILCAVLFYLAYKKHFKYTMCVYLTGYGIFRFCIEFIRGDDRGAYLFGILSPSQVFSIAAILIAIGLFIYLKKKEV